MRLISLMKETGRRKRVGALLLWAGALLLFLPGLSRATVGNEDCLECHDTYGKYIHGGMTCAGCHSTIRSLPHPDKLPQPVCASCHRKIAESFRSNRHAQKGLACGRCHDVHFAGGAKKSCLACHSNVNHKALPSSKQHLEKLSCLACHTEVDRAQMTVLLEMHGGKPLEKERIDRDDNNFVDLSEWHALEDLLRTQYKNQYRMKRTYQVVGDPHTITAKPAECSSCHGPSGRFARGTLEVAEDHGLKIPIDTRIFVPELPSAKEFKKTVHGRAGVVCADCHISQKRIAEGGSENAIVCGKCHEEVESVYAKSVHVSVGAAHCTECHNPHRITSYKELATKSRVAVCSRCHQDYVRRHAWLPNTSLHFDYLECATCHSPRSKKSLVYYFARKTPAGKVRLSYDEMTNLAGVDPAPWFREQKGSPDRQIGRLYALLSQKDERITIDASIMVTKVFHDYSETHPKEKQCVTCHSREASFYDSMLFLLPGRVSSTYVPVRDSLLAAFPIGTSVDFFLIGENKIRKNDLYRFLRLKGPQEAGLKWISFFGFIVIVLVVAGVCVHIAIRLMVRK